MFQDWMRGRALRTDQYSPGRFDWNAPGRLQPCSSRHPGAVGGWGSSVAVGRGVAAAVNLVGVFGLDGVGVAIEQDGAVMRIDVIADDLGANAQVAELVSLREGV